MIGVLGSTALVRQGYDVGRKPADIDLVGRYDDLTAFLDIRCESIVPSRNGKKLIGRSQDAIYECEIAWPGSTSEVLLQTMEREGSELASLNISYCLKLSHRYSRNSPHFLKTMRDIHWMRSQGATIEHRDLLIIREREALDYSHPRLNQNKSSFFSDDGVDYVYEHDTIHEAVRLFDRPAYEFFKPDSSEVKVSRQMFDDLPIEKQLAAVY